MKERSVTLSTVGLSDWICMDRRSSAGDSVLVVKDVLLWSLLLKILMIVEI